MVSREDDRNSEVTRRREQRINRLEEALRANLRRRKEQDRARQVNPSRGGAGAGPSPNPRPGISEEPGDA